MRPLLTLVALTSAACSGSSPTAPAPLPVPPATATLTGHLTATNGGQPLSGVTGAFIGQAVTTDGAGTFHYTGVPATSFLTLTGPSIVPRSVTVNAVGTRDIAIDAFALDGHFDPTFYRELVRNTFDAPSTAEPLRRWTHTPSIYLKTVDEAGAPLTEATLTLLETVLRDGVPRWTSGALGTPTIERGTGTREGQAGWITVRYPSPGDPTRCGRSQVGVDGGIIELETHGTNCRTATSLLAPIIIRHELGHALGFWHTDNPTDLMWAGTWTQARADALPSPRELYHAALAYRRPVGNVDPDTDPSSIVNLAPMSVY